MGSTEYRVVSYTVVTVVAPGGNSITRSFPQEPITISSHAMPSMQSITQFYKQALPTVQEQLSTALKLRASSAQT